MSSRSPHADVTIRAAVLDDIPAMAETVRQGFTTYAAFTPAGWEPPRDVSDHEMIRGWLSLPRACALLALAGAEPAGHAVLIPASASRLQSPDPGLAHVIQVFAREPFWGSGVATALHARMVAAAVDAGFTRGCLFVLAGQARARAFYEREGWSAAGPALFEPALGTEVVEYGRPLVAGDVAAP